MYKKYLNVFDLDEEEYEEVEDDGMYGSVQLVPTKNGYVVYDGESDELPNIEDLNVFPTLDKAFDFIKENMKPTGIESEFLEKV